MTWSDKGQNNGDEINKTLRHLKLVGMENNSVVWTLLKWQLSCCVWPFACDGESNISSVCVTVSHSINKVNEQFGEKKIQYCRLSSLFETLHCGPSLKQG